MRRPRPALRRPYTCTRVAKHGPYTFMKAASRPAVNCGELSQDVR